MGNPLFLIVVNLYMENWKPQIIATTPDNCKPTKLKQYVDDTFCLVDICMTTHLQQHMNTVDQKCSIRFTKEDEQNNSYSFIQHLQERLRQREIHSIQEENPH